MCEYTSSMKFLKCCNNVVKYPTLLSFFTLYSVEFFLFYCVEYSVNNGSNLRDIAT